MLVLLPRFFLAMKETGVWGPIFVGHRADAGRLLFWERVLSPLFAGRLSRPLCPRPVGPSHAQLQHEMVFEVLPLPACFEFPTFVFWPLGALLTVGAGATAAA